MNVVNNIQKMQPGCSSWKRAAVRALRAQAGAKWSVVLLLLPPTIFGGWYFGWSAVVTLATTLMTCLVVSILPHVFSGHPWRIFNPGTVITGLLLGLTLSPGTPFYMILVGALVAELAAKAPIPLVNRPLFNPAALGRGAIAILETYDLPVPADLSSGASPLMVIAGGHSAPDYIADLLLGMTKGAIGETSALILIVVGVLLLLFVAVKREAAIAMIITAPLLILLMPVTAEISGHAPWVLNPLVYLLGGSTLLLAFFFATDPMTTPRTRIGGWIFGVGAASIGVLGRLYTTIPGCEMWGILIMNLLTPAIDWLVETRHDWMRPKLVDWLAQKHRPDSGSVSFYANPTGEYHDINPAWVGDRLAIMRPATGSERFGVLHETLRSKQPTDIVNEVLGSGLSGCGGAHFLVAKKWQFVRQHAGPRILVINGQEGEEDSFKDHALMAYEPHLVIEGAALAAFSIEASEVHVVVNPQAEESYKKLEAAIKDLRQDFPDLPFIFNLVRGPGLYICGEETALIEYLEGRPGEPQLRPPYPAESGLHGKPTVIQNVETVSWLPLLVHGGGGDFLQAGPLKLVTLCGAVANPGVYVVPLQSTLGEVLEIGGGMAEDSILQAFAVGGPAGGFLPVEASATLLDEEALARAGAVLGSASIRIIDTSQCLVDECYKTLQFFERETCGRCSACRIGTSVLRNLFADLTRTSNGPQVLAEINAVTMSLWIGTMCGFGRGVPNRLKSLQRYWPELLTERVNNPPARKGCAV